MNDFDRDTSPIKYPKSQNVKVFLFTFLCLLLTACILLGILLALVNTANGGRGWIW